MSEAYLGLTVPLYTDAADGPAAFRALVASGPIPRFANAGARDAAITSPVAGQVCFRADFTGMIEVYDGSDWIGLIGGSVPAHTHAATDIASGVLAVARIPNLDATKITTGTIARERLPAASTSLVGAVQLSAAIDSNSNTEAATSKAVKTAYDKADHNHPYISSSEPRNVASNNLGEYRVRNIYVSNSTPPASQRQHGDIWFKT